MSIALIAVSLFIGMVGYQLQCSEMTSLPSSLEVRVTAFLERALDHE